MKVGFVGKRSLCNVNGVRSVEGVFPHAFFDPNPATAKEAEAAGLGVHDSFEAVLETCDAVCIGSPMHLHAPQALQAMALGKGVLSEVTAAVTLDECAALKQGANSAACYFFAENYCYSEQALVALELVRSGRFGPIYYGEGDYVHEVRFLHRFPDGSPTWRMEWQVGRPGNTYCTHELGPLMRWIRAADPAVRIESVACFGSGVHTDPTLNHDDCTLTLVRLSNGGLLKLRLDMLSNRPERIAYTLQGITGCLEFEHDQNRIWMGENKTVSWDDPVPRRWAKAEDYRDILSPSLREELTAATNEGHGGGDYFVGRRFAQALLGHCAPEIGIQDAVEWTVVGLLSQQSILQGGVPVPMPDFVYQ